VTRLREEDGFTLVELLVTMLILTIIFGAVLGAFEAFQRFTVTSNARADTQDMVRNAVDVMTQRLRGAVDSGTASGVDRANANDLVVRVVDPALSGGSNAARQAYLRYCVDPSTQKLYAQSLGWTTAAPATLPVSACGSTTGWATTDQLADHVTTAGGNIFSFSPSASAVSKVGIDLTSDLDPARPPAATQLRTGVVLRNLNQPPTAQLSCVGAGSGSVTCDSTGSSDDSGQALGLAWSYAAGACPAASYTAIGATTILINQTGLSPGQYCFKLVVTDSSGMTGTSTATVAAT
jgi:prepilin-type N-terminal cleavage/methylation domain-containing protein